VSRKEYLPFRLFASNTVSLIQNRRFCNFGMKWNGMKTQMRFDKNIDRKSKIDKFYD
jgi:hypothetical protein